MSSAALQAAPHQPTSVSTHSPVAATSSNRPYTSGSSQSRDPYYNQTSNASPSANRRPNKRPSGNGASQNNPPPAQQATQHYPPQAPSAPQMSNRTSNSNHNSPTVPVGPTGLAQMAPGDHQRGVPPVVSPRTSSNRNSTSAAVSTAERASRRERYVDTTNSPRAASHDGQQDRPDTLASNGNTQVNGADEGRRASRRAQPSGEALPHRPSGTREARAAQAAASHRSGSAAQSPTVSREASEVLNRMVVSKPEVDIERERERMAEAIPSSPHSQQTPRGALAVVGNEGVEDSGRGGSRSRHDHAASAGKQGKSSKFGDYYLGNTIGEGEFGKVKMGWKQEGGVQVAVKLIRRDSVGTNPTRLAKVYREIAILREISHPNIVRLHEMVETEKQIGIILEYASGGELFDYILTHRYLKDHPARRLFAQLVSGVGYLHKKGIVHRDLKLENLLLDRNRNIIITDFGFANTFNADDELGDEIEYNLSNREFVKRMELDKVVNGTRRGDLMQTSCGSPCYAAPELVVSDSLYTGRKVDVWSCGVILYAMLAGYLPFDDDPANPEGDNINLLYKYIVSTPLTFPEYVTPHARDLLRRILVPDPRKRADLFEVARHSWLSEYSHVVGFITSSASTTADIATATVGSVEPEAPVLARSSSVREPTKPKPATPIVGELGRKHGGVDPDSVASHPKTTKDNKRRTVQVEYVAPNTKTQRGESATAATPSGSSRTRARAGSTGPVEVPASKPPTTRRQISTEKPLPQDPPRDGQYASQNQGRRPSTGTRQQNMPPPTRPVREPPRAASDTHALGVAGPPVSIANTRPNTGGSMTSTGSHQRMPLTNRGSYSQPAAPSVARTNVHSQMSQPTGGKQYNISQPILQDGDVYGRPSSQQVPSKFAQVAGIGDEPQQPPPPEKGHKRSNTIGGIFSRTNSIFGGKSRKDSQTDRPPPEKQKKYPPVSMSAAGIPGQGTPRQSMESRRSISFGFGKKRSGSINGSQSTLQEKQTRRFSLLPASFSLKAIGIGKELGTPGAPPSDYDSRPSSRGDQLAPQTSQTTRNISGSTAPHPSTADGVYDRQRDSPIQDRRGTSTGSPSQQRPAQQRYASQSNTSDPRSGVPPQFLPPLNFRHGESATESESSLNDFNQRGGQPLYPAQGYGQDYSSDRRPTTNTTTNSRGNGRGVLQKNNRRFTEAYEQDSGNGYGPTHNDHAGSSGAARKVMDFFRRRGKDRTNER